MMSVQSKLGSGITRTVAVAIPDTVSPVKEFTACAVLTYSPSPTPEPTISNSLITRLSLRSTPRPVQLNSLPFISGSISTPSTRAEPATYLKPAGKLSMMVTSGNGTPKVLLKVMVYGTRSLRTTFNLPATFDIPTTLPSSESTGM